MQPFKLFPWLMLLFSVWVLVSVSYYALAGVAGQEAFLAGGVAGFIVVLFMSILTGKGDFDKMMIDELDAGGNLN